MSRPERSRRPGQVAGQSARAHHAAPVDQHMLDAVGLAVQTAGATGEVVAGHDPTWPYRGRVEHHHVRVAPLRHLAAVAQPEVLRGPVREQANGFFERQQLAIAHALRQQQTWCTRTWPACPCGRRRRTHPAAPGDPATPPLASATTRRRDPAPGEGTRCATDRRWPHPAGRRTWSTPRSAATSPTFGPRDPAARDRRSRRSRDHPSSSAQPAWPRPGRRRAAAGRAWSGPGASPGDRARAS